MSLSLLKQTVKANGSLWAIVTVVMNIILGQLLLMGDETAELVPILYYGMLCFAICALYIVITTNKLIAGQVDKGSMAYILSTPIKRSTVVLTQMFYLVSSLVLMFGSLMINFMICNQIADNAAVVYSNESIFYINAGAFLVALALSGICFMTSGIFNLSKYSTGIGGMIVVTFLLLSLVGSFSNFGVEGLDVFKNLTIISLYNIQDILADANNWVAHLSVLGGISIVTYATGSIWFTRKDLPL